MSAKNASIHDSWKQELKFWIVVLLFFLQFLPGGVSAAAIIYFAVINPQSCIFCVITTVLLTFTIELTSSAAIIYSYPCKVNDTVLIDKEYRVAHFCPLFTILIAQDTQNYHYFLNAPRIVERIDKEKCAIFVKNPRPASLSILMLISLMITAIGLSGIFWFFYSLYQPHLRPFLLYSAIASVILYFHKIAFQIYRQTNCDEAFMLHTDRIKWNHVELITLYAVLHWSFHGGFVISSTWRLYFLGSCSYIPLGSESSVFRNTAIPMQPNR